MRIKIDARGDYVLSGASYGWRDPAAALRHSRRLTTRPRVLTYNAPGGEIHYAAGDAWIDSQGRRGVYHYGRGDRILEVVDVL
jgi:hypothetical protein